MHLNKILEQIKRHQSPSEAIDKLSTALEKHEGSLLEKGFTILKSELAANMYEAINGPHFDEEHARYAVEGMENEDGTKGPHWTVEETTSVANQMGINLKSEKHNKWVISCDGEQRKLSVSEDKTMMTDSNIGLTIATEKSQIVNMVKQSLEDCRIKKESLSKIDEEMRRCEDILKILNVNSDITTNVTKDFKELDELRAEVKELKQLLQNISTVRPEENNIDPPTEEKENEI